MVFCSLSPANFSVLLSWASFLTFGFHKKRLSTRGYVKGGYYDDAVQTLIKMLDLGFNPDYLDRAAVLQGRKNALSIFNSDTNMFERYGLVAKIV